jgi:hypothetical protein
MEDTGTPAASSTVAATSISAELDAMFEGVGSETDSSSTETETTPVETAPEDNPQDSTAHDPSPMDFEPEEADAKEAPPPAEAKPVEAEAPPQTPVADDDKEGEEYEIRGKKWIRYPEARGKEVFAGYQASKALAKELGLFGPLTPEMIQELAGEKKLLDHIDFDAMSADPTEQARAFRYLFTQARKAYEGQITKHNPHETMADALLYAAETAAPEVIQGIEHRVTQQTFNQLYAKAVAAGLDTDAGKQLLASVQRAEQALTGNYRKRADLAKQATSDPIDQRLRQVEAREQNLQRSEESRARQEWQDWSNGTKAAVDSGIDKSIANIMKPVTASLKNFPETRKNVEIRLQQEITDALLKDQRINNERQSYYKQASIAGSESVRNGWRARIVQMYTARAEQILRDKAPAILSESALAIKARSDKTHERLKGTQSLRGTPAGGVAPNGTTAPSTGNGKFDSKSWAAEFEAAFN